MEGDYMVSQEKEIQLLADYREKLGLQGAFAEGIYHVDIPYPLRPSVSYYCEPVLAGWG